MENRLNDASRPIHKHNSLYTKEGLHPLPYGSQTEHANLQQRLWLCLGTGYGVSNWTSTPLEGSSIGSDANAASS
jgi:hypothetical protein